MTVTRSGGCADPRCSRSAHRQIATNQEVQYDHNGEPAEYALTSLPVGSYRVMIESQGFKTSIQAVTELGAGSTTRLSTRLEVGSVQQTVEVSAQSTTHCKWTTANFTMIFSNKLIQDLPTVVSGNMRSPFDLANLTPGVQGTDTDVRIAGGQQAGWGATLDGGSVAGEPARFGGVVWRELAFARRHRSVHGGHQRV